MEATDERTRFSWVVLFACTFLQFITDGSLKSFGLFYVEILDEFHESVSFTILISGVMLGVYCLSSLPIMLYLMDEITPRGVLILGSILITVGYSISCLAPNIYFLFFSLSVLTGTGMGCIFSPSIYVLGSHFPSKRATYNGIAVSSGSLGVLICPPLYQYLIKSYGLRGAFLLTGAVLLHNLPMACLMQMPKTKDSRKFRESSDLENKANGKSSLGSELSGHFITNRSLYDSVLINKYSNSSQLCGSDPLLIRKEAKDSRSNIINIDTRTASESCLYSKSPQKKQHPLEYLSSSTNMVGFSVGDLSTPATSTSDERGDEALSKSSKITSLLKDSFFIVFLITNALSNTVTSTFVSFLPLYARENKIDDGKMVILVSLTGAMDLFGRFLCGVLADCPYFSTYQILALSQTVCGFTLLFNQLVSTFTELVIVCLLIGLFSNMHLTLKHSVMVDICGAPSYPTALAITTVSQLPLFVIGPYLFGFLKDISGSFAASYHMTGSIAILSGFLFMYIPLVRRCRICRT